MRTIKHHLRRASGHRVQVSIAVGDLAAILLVVLLAVPVAQHFGTAGYVMGGDRSFAQIRGYLHNPLAYFMQRSPGARVSQGLIQTKHPVSRVLSQVRHRPHEEVLANVRYAPPIPYVNDLIPNAAPTFLPANLPVPAQLGGGGVPGGFSAIPPAPSPIVPFVIPNSNPNTIPNNNNSAVPESSTWLMLIWGMALVGIGLRSKHRPAKGAVVPGFSPKS